MTQEDWLMLKDLRSAGLKEEAIRFSNLLSEIAENNINIEEILSLNADED